MASALVPFAVGLGLNVFVGFEGFAGTAWATTSGLVVTALALWFWFGLEWLAVWRKGQTPMEHLNEEVPLAKKIDQMLTEARVILPGAQAVLGFQLVVMLTAEFESLQASSKVAHAAALGLVTLATVLLIAPAAYHRSIEETRRRRSLSSAASSSLLQRLPSRLALSPTSMW